MMAARARARVPVFKKAHALMIIIITCNGKYTEILLGARGRDADTDASPKELAGLH